MNEKAEFKLEWFNSKLSFWSKKLQYKNSNDDSWNKLLRKLEEQYNIPCNSSPRKKALIQLLSNLFFIHQKSEGLSCLKILIGNQNTGSGSFQYQIYGTSGRVLADFVHGLTSSGLIKYKKGVEHHPTKVKLDSIGYDIINSYIDCRYLVDDPVLIIIKDSKGVSLPNSNTGNNAKKPLLAKYNKLLSETRVEAANTPIYTPELSIFRLFSDKSCRTNGRLHGSIVQQMPKELRRSITINGQRTCEVDINSTHPLFAYAAEGVDITEKTGFRPKATNYQGDPYGVTGLINSTSIDRRIAKQLITIMLNIEWDRSNESSLDFAKNVKMAFWPNFQEGDKKAQAIKSIYQYSDELNTQYDVDGNPYLPEESAQTKYKLEDIVLHLLNRHELINNWFGSDAWKKLNKLESDVLMRVLSHFTNKGIPILTIHDSVRISAAYKEELVEVFTREIQNQFSTVEFSKPELLVDVDTDGPAVSEIDNRKKLHIARSVIRKDHSKDTDIESLFDDLHKYNYD